MRKVPTAPMKALRERLFTPVSNVRCPYCGIAETSTLDHYLPKEKYPQFAVFSKNLVPCCSPCNELKTDLVLNAGTSVRVFLHPYFDAIPRVAFLSVAVNLAGNAMALKFSVNGLPGVSTIVLQQVQAHFRTLKLAQRYPRNALEYLRSQRHDYRRFYRAGGSGRVRNELGHEASKFENDLGPNHWRTVLCRELAGHAQFCGGGFAVLEQVG